YRRRSHRRDQGSDRGRANFLRAAWRTVRKAVRRDHIERNYGDDFGPVAEIVEALAAASAYFKVRCLTQTPLQAFTRIHVCPLNSHSIICKNFGRNSFAARGSARCYIRHRFRQSSSTRPEFWSDTTAICSGSLRSLVRNTDSSVRLRTTWWNGKATNTRGSIFRFTVFTATIASRRRKC